MNTKYIGDAFDHWKGSMISLLAFDSLLRNVIVEPMITDQSPWNLDEKDTYRRLLRLQETDIVIHADSTFIGDRNKYFDEIPKDGDVFLDPDTGIATGKSSRQHVKISEIAELCDNSDRIVMIYQHSARGDFHNRLQIISKRLLSEIPQITVMLYKCGFVALIFVSKEIKRMNKLHDFLRFYLKGAAGNRIMMFYSQR